MWSPSNYFSYKHSFVNAASSLKKIFHDGVPAALASEHEGCASILGEEEKLADQNLLMLNSLMAILLTSFVASTLAPNLSRQRTISRNPS